MNYVCRYNPYLYHHGIKGMKWGVRRYQNADGSYTSAGKERYGIGERLTNKIADNYKQQYKMTDEQAKAEAEKTKKMLKNVAIGAAAVVGVAAGVYIARNIGRNYVDSVIKAGTTLKTVAMDPDRINTGNAFYTAHRNNDAKKYLGFGREKVQTLFGPVNTGRLKNQISVGLNDNAKIAGYKTGKKEFDYLMKNNSEFRDLFKNKAISNTVKNKHFRNDYIKFNTYDLLDNDPNKVSQQRLQKIFYDSLKKKGYSGVRDFNDAVKSGYNTKATIFFDKSKLGSQSIKQLTEKEVSSGEKYLRNKVLRDEFIKPGNVALGSSFVGAVALGSRDTDLESKYERKW